MAGSLAYVFSRIGPWFIIVAPIIGWIGVALSGSNTSTQASGSANGNSRCIDEPIRAWHGLILLIYLILNRVLFYLFFPGVMSIG
jgi:L-lactate permease